MKYLQTYENNDNKPVIDEDVFVQLFKENCKKFSFDDMPILKSHSSRLIDTGYGYQTDNFFHQYKHFGKILRYSAYSPNGYTLLFNHLPSWKKFPKRNIICSTSRIGLGGDGTFRVIPFDNSNWGVVPGDDIQSTEVINKHSSKETKKFCKEYNISSLYSLASLLQDKEISQDSWMKMRSDLKRKYKKSCEDDGYGDYNCDKFFDINYLNKIFSPESLGMVNLDYNELITYSFPNKSDKFHWNAEPSCEIWTDSNVLYIDVDKIAIFRKKHNI